MKLLKDLGMKYATKSSKKKRHFGLYECPDCGKSVEIDMANVNHNGVSKCIDCSRIKHGDTNTRLHRVWAAMKQRCYNKNNKHYRYYGGRGVRVCNEWKDDYISFRKWAMSNGHSEDLSIDRIDSSGNYSPKNCRWVSDVVQSCNTRLIHSTNTSGYRGVSYNKKAKKFSSQLYLDKRKYYLGLYSDAKDAAIARDKKVIELGAMMPLNFNKENYE